jgi:hypothetical protein
VDTIGASSSDPHSLEEIGFVLMDSEAADPNH